MVVQWLGLGAFIAKGMCSIPGQGTKILQAMWHNQKKKKNPSEAYKSVTSDFLIFCNYCLFMIKLTHM